MLWPVAHVGSPASIKLLNKKLCTNFRLSLSCLFSEYRKRTVRSIATKRLVEKSHFCEHKAVRKSIRVHNCNSWVLICFQLSSCLHLLFSSAMIKHSEAKQPVRKGFISQPDIEKSQGRNLEAQGDAEIIMKCHLVVVQFVFLHNPGHPAQGWHCPSLPIHRLGPPTENHSSRKRPTSMPTGQSDGGNS